MPVTTDKKAQIVGDYQRAVWGHWFPGSTGGIIDRPYKRFNRSFQSSC